MVLICTGCIQTEAEDAVPPGNYKFDVKEIELNCSAVKNMVAGKQEMGPQTLTHWGPDKMAAISQTTISNAFSWMKMLEIWYKFHWSLFLRVQLTIFQHWFR